MDVAGQIVSNIIKEQQNIIGPVAVEQAKKVPGLIVENNGQEIKFNGDQTNIIENLVEKYQALFGKASVEVCKDASRGLIDKLPKDKIPPILT